MRTANPKGGPAVLRLLRPSREAACFPWGLFLPFCRRPGSQLESGRELGWSQRTHLETLAAGEPPRKALQAALPHARGLFSDLLQTPSLNR